MLTTASSRTLTVEVVRDPARLAEFRAFWATRATWLAGDLDYFLQHVCGRPEVVRPHVVIALRDGLPSVVLLGRLERRDPGFRIGYLRLPMPRSRILVFDDGGLLAGATAEEARALVSSVLGSLAANEADAAALYHLDPAHPVHAEALGAPGRSMVDRIPSLEGHWIRRIERSRTLAQSASAKTRNTMKRKARQLAEATGGEPRLVCHQAPDELDRLVAAAESIARRSYQRGLGVGFVNDARTRAQLEFLARKGLLRGFVLHAGPAPAAFWIGSVCGRTFASEFLAFDPDLARFSPGRHLVWSVIEELEATSGDETVDVVDFGPGEADYKSHFGTEKLVHVNLWIFGAGWRGQMLRLARAGVQAVDRRLRHLLADSGLLARAKRLWRQRVTRRSDSPQRKDGGNLPS